MQEFYQPAEQNVNYSENEHDKTFLEKGVTQKKIRNEPN